MTATAQTDMPSKNVKTFGIYGGYTSRNESALAGVNFTYRFSRYVRIAPSADYTFRHHGDDAFDISLNYHAPFAVDATGRFNIYPVAGVGYSEWNRNYVDMTVRNNTDVRKRTDRFGINLGGGIEYFATPTMRISAEAIWRARKDFSSGIFTLSLGYVF